MLIERNTIPASQLIASINHFHRNIHAYCSFVKLIHNKFMEHSAYRKAKSLLAGQQIPLLLLKTFHCRAHGSTHIWMQMNFLDHVPLTSILILYAHLRLSIPSFFLFC